MADLNHCLRGANDWDTLSFGCTPDEIVQMRYQKALNEVVDDAVKTQHLGILVDTIALTTAELLVECVGADLLDHVLDTISRYTLELSQDEEWDD